MELMGSDDIAQLVDNLLDERTKDHCHDVRGDVAAIITVEDDQRYLPATLRSVFQQTVLPQTIVVAVCSKQARTIHRSYYRDISLTGMTSSWHSGRRSMATIQVIVLGIEHARSFGQAVMRAYQAIPSFLRGYGHEDLPAGATINHAHPVTSANKRRQRNSKPDIKALWVLHDDSRPATNQCLEHLLDAWNNAPSAAIFGAKQLDWSGEHLRSVGSYLDGDHLNSLVVEGEIDQEQYDTRSDVYSVSLAGALLSLHAIERTGQHLDPWFTTFGEAQDWCRRICVSGGRVVVVPRAAIAHVQARSRGVRSSDGSPVDVRHPLITVRQRLVTNERFRYTSKPRSTWPFFWCFSILVAVVAAVRQLFNKRPSSAWWALCLPWIMVLSMPRLMSARARVVRAATVSPSTLRALRVDKSARKDLYFKRRAFLDQQLGTTLNSLQRDHIRTRTIRRCTGAALACVCAALWVVCTNLDIARSLLAGGSLYSDMWLSSQSSYHDLVQSASTSWVFGVSTGVALPPTPWLLVWLLASTVCLGNTVAAISLLFFVSAPLSALSCWAFAGIFTRSDAVRVVVSMLWVAFGSAMGCYANANLAILTVMIFLPAALAFVFRAVGMYHTEDPFTPHPSVQAAACAALCFVPVVCAEPQLLFALLLTFVGFMLLTHRHRVMLLLIPIPSAVALAPTLMNAIRYASVGAWRQVFGDITLATYSSNGSPRALHFVSAFFQAFSIDASLSSFGSLLWWLTMAVLGSCILMAILTVLSLILPFALRTSRIMWIVMLAGGITALVSVRVAISVDHGRVVAGSLLPGMTLVILGALGCVCLVAGGAIKKFVPLALSVQDITVRMNAGKARLITVARAVLVVLLTSMMLVFFVFSYLHVDQRSIAASDAGLPMVALDYLDRSDNYRVLAIHASSDREVSYAVMRTAKGDLVDSSPAYRVDQLNGVTTQEDRILAESVAQLLSSADNDALNSIASLGFGGVYIVRGADRDVSDRDIDEVSADTNTIAGNSSNTVHTVGSLSSTTSTRSVDSANEELIANVTGCANAQLMVSNAQGVYLRIMVNSDEINQSIDDTRQLYAQSIVWRRAWITSLSVIVALYLLVAAPRPRVLRRMS